MPYSQRSSVNEGDIDRVKRKRAMILIAIGIALLIGGGILYAAFDNAKKQPPSIRGAESVQVTEFAGEYTVIVSLDNYGDIMAENVSIILTFMPNGGVVAGGTFTRTLNLNDILPRGGSVNVTQKLYDIPQKARFVNAKVNFDYTKPKSFPVVIPILMIVCGVALTGVCSVWLKLIYIDARKAPESVTYSETRDVFGKIIRKVDTYVSSNNQAEANRNATKRPLEPWEQYSEKINITDEILPDEEIEEEDLIENIDPFAYGDDEWSEEDFFEQEELEQEELEQEELGLEEPEQEETDETNIDDNKAADEDTTIQQPPPLTQLTASLTIAQKPLEEQPKKAGPKKFNR